MKQCKGVPTRAAVPWNPTSKRAYGWLVGLLSFWHWRMGGGQLKKSPWTVSEEENVSGKLAIAFMWELLLPLPSTFSSYASYLASWRNSLFQFFLLQADSSTAKTTLARLGSPFASFASTSFFINIFPLFCEHVSSEEEMSSQVDIFLALSLTAT